MADRRGVRSSSRRITPQPTLPSAPAPSSRDSRKGTTRVPKNIVLESEDEPAPGANGRPRRSARQASVESTASNTSKSGRKRRGAGKPSQKELQPSIELSTVTEDPTSLEENDLDDAVRRPATPPPPPQEVSSNFTFTKSPGGLSTLSGTTAKSSTTVSDATHLDVESMTSELVALHQNTRLFLEEATPKSAKESTITQKYEELLQPGTKTAKLFARRWQTLDPSLLVFIRPGHTYIHPKTVLLALFEEKAPKCLGRPDAVLYLANLAFLAKYLLPSQKDQSTSYDTIREIDSLFPKQFTSSFGRPAPGENSGFSGLLDETFAFGLEIRTQIAIQYLQLQHANGSGDMIGSLRETFYTVQPDGSEQVAGWHMDGLGDDDTELPPRLEKLIEARYSELRELLGDPDEVDEPEEFVDFDRFEKRFPWSSLIVSAVQWIRHRAEELESIIKMSKGIEGLEAQLHKDLEAKKAALQPEIIPARKSRKSHGRASVNVEGINMLKKLEEMAAAEESGSREITGMANSSRVPDTSDVSGPSRSNIASNINYADDGPLFMDDDHADQMEEEEQRLPNHFTRQLLSAAELAEIEDESAPRRSLGKRPVVDTVERNSQGSQPRPSAQAPTSRRDRLLALERTNKENRPSADEETTEPPVSTRRAFIDQQEGARQIEFGNGFDTQASQSSASRPQASQNQRKRQREEDSEDDAFQQDERQIVTERRGELPPPRKAPKFNPFVAQPLVRRERDEVVLQQPSTSRVQPIARDVPPPSSYALVQEQARQNVAASKAIHGDERKDRVAWTPSEAQALTEAIVMYGCKWKFLETLEDEDGQRVFSGRNNVHLKDKARNMKFSMLKARQIVPAEFARVTLSTSHKKELAARGILLPE